MALEDMARPEIVNNTKISGRFTNEGKDVNKSVQTPDKAPSSPSLSTIKGNFNLNGRAQGK
tara:strand:+ start:54 stop:236 length:183 start_codon:yes stop_codon:yes gene_type:complete